MKLGLSIRNDANGGSAYLKIEKIQKLLSTVLMPEGLMALFFWKPFSLTSFWIAKRLKELGISYRTIIDGGANIGQFARAAVENFPEAKIISFEPLPEVAKKLKKNLRDCHGRMWVIETALGSKSGIISFYRNAHSHSSSALPLHPNHKKAFPKAQKVETLKVRSTTLDHALKIRDLKGPVLLKLDLQGFELEALYGGAKTLQKVDAILLETSFKPMYKGEPSFRRIKKFLEAKGFEFKGPIDVLKDYMGRAVQMDVLFIKA